VLTYVSLKNFIHFIRRRHHCRRRPAKFIPLLGAQSFWAKWDLYRVTPAVTRCLGFSCFPRDRPVQYPLTTSKRDWSALFGNCLRPTFWECSYDGLGLGRLPGKLTKRDWSSSFGPPFLSQYLSSNNVSACIWSTSRYVKAVRSDSLIFLKWINVYIFKTNCKSYTLSINYTNNLNLTKN
jgi:hypothetical protein